MKRLIGCLLSAIITVSGWAEDNKTEPYSVELVKKAEAGDSDAQVQLGNCYKNGSGIEKDYKKAAQWYAKAADLGDSWGLNNLAACYEGGLGLEKNKKEAIKLFTKAAEMGGARAQTNLGVRYANGISVEKNEYEALKWYQKAAIQDFPDAQLGLSWLLSTSNDPKIRNGVEALKWIKKVIEAEKSPRSSQLECLAAAYAENGDFESAIQTQEKAILINKEEDYLNLLRNQLTSYKNKRAWRVTYNALSQSATNPQQNP